MTEHRHNQAQGDVHEPTHAQIAAVAYQIYQDEGCIPGRDDANWRDAENLVRQQSEGGEWKAGKDGANCQTSQPRLETSRR